MKSIIRIATEQYCYIEAEFEGTEAEIISKYEELSNLYKNKNVGLPAKDFNIALDKYLDDATISEQEYCSMSLAQQQVIQELKKAFKRIEKKVTRTGLEALESDQDRYLEHKFHDVYEPKCSECYKQAKGR